MGQYRPGSNGLMVRSANMSSMTSPRQQPNFLDETSEYEEMQRELRPAYTAEHRICILHQQNIVPCILHWHQLQVLSDQCPENK
jgi:hypothetical protein